MCVVRLTGCSACCSPDTIRTSKVTYRQVYEEDVCPVSKPVYFPEPDVTGVRAACFAEALSSVHGVARLSNQNQRVYVNPANRLSFGELGLADASAERRVRDKQAPGQHAWHLEGPFSPKLRGHDRDRLRR